MTLAAGYTSLILLMSLGSIIPPLLILTYLSLVAASFTLMKGLFDRFLPGDPYQIRKPLTVVFAQLVAIAITNLAIPHLFLAMNALPLAVTLSIFTLASFIPVYEYVIDIPHLQLGRNYSLIKFLMNPRESIQTLRLILKTVRPQTPEGLRLPEADRKALVKRQTAAINELEKGAIIDDLALYNKHLASETKRVTDANRNKTLTHLQSQMQPSTIAEQALENTKAEAKTLEETYISTLANPEQVANYKTYRELTRDISPPYAECQISRESIGSNSADFIVLEKRYTDTDECVNGCTRLWHFAKSYVPLFSMRDQYGQAKTAEEPTNRDPFFKPVDVNSRKTDYYFHTYQVIKAHGLSLCLCDAIEKLNKSLKATPKRKQANIVSSVPTTNSESSNVATYRNTPPMNPVSVSDQSMFTHDGNILHSELDPFLANTSTLTM